METYTFLEAVKALEAGECDEIRNKFGSFFVLDEKGNVARDGQGGEGILMIPSLYLGRWILIGEKENKSKDNKIFSGPNSEKLWAEIRDLKDNPIKDILYSMGCKLQELEDKMLEE